MALRKRLRGEAEVSTESLNDIMFFLLLFFLIMSTMVSPNVIKVNLPDSNTHAQATVDPIHLGVNEKLEYQVDEIKTNFFGLEEVLKKKLKGRVDPTVVLHMDRNLKYQDFVDVLQLGPKLNCKMVCATKASNQK
ncbi:MAG: ExbD/TolR family protein [Bacteroidota bacterium]|jgi:biopolymer transport protein ExbD